MTIQRIGIISCGIGNVGSVSNMIKKVGAIPTLIDNPSEINHFEKLVLPGVGNFGEAMNIINTNGWLSSLDKAYNDGKLILGICIGMQLMCIESEESPGIKGLSWIKAKVKKLPVNKSMNLRVPHMGWNEVITKKGISNSLFSKNKQDFYFVHSYYVDPEDKSIITSKTEHSIIFASSFQSKNLYGVQFHPEKSHFSGINLFKKFIEI